MKILILNSILYTADNYVIPSRDSIKDCMIYNLALGFKELGHQVTLIAASEYKPVKEETYDIDVIFLKSQFKKILLPSVLPFQPKLWSYLLKERKKIDLIISSEVFAFPSLFAVIFAPEKTIIWHELAVHTKKMKSIPSYFWYNVIAKLFYKNTLIIVRSENAKKFISKYLPHVSTDAVEHGINLQKFRFSKDKKKQFIVVSQLILRKNISNIITKFYHFLQKEVYSDFKLIIVGIGELETELKEQVSQLGIDKNIDFVGFKSHSVLNQLLAESMAMLIDTKQDNNMVSIPESIVSGTPVVTNLIPTNSSTISEYNLGIAKTEWDESDLKDIIDNNDFYVQNCIAKRGDLSSESSALKMITAYLKYKNNKQKHQIIT
ncbi:MAG: glycosyltransferase [Candidatus Symbiothrix sp.]|jgi:1,2-diacylglycerol 3-alpha-glucosyltransferase|nr:glycosyltransferase [Candidatus Symbiothrix sp.]